MPSAKFHYDIVYWQEPYDLGHITIYQIGDLCCNPGYEVPVHDQQCYEISYIASGKGVFISDGAETPVSEGQIHLNRPGQKHRIVSSLDAPLRYVYLGFWFKEEHPDFQFFRLTKEFFDSTDECMAHDTQNIYDYFFAAFSEIISADNMMHEMLKTYLSQIIITSFRALSRAKTSKYQHSRRTATEEEILYRIVNYIESDNCNINKLADIGAELGYSYPYLSQLFSNRMGYSIKDHFRRVQFARAVKMMKEDKTITEIAAILRYSTVYAFSRAFSAQFGMPPSRYKEQVLGKMQEEDEQEDAV